MTVIVLAEQENERLTRSERRVLDGGEAEAGDETQEHEAPVPGYVGAGRGGQREEDDAEDVDAAPPVPVGADAQQRGAQELAQRKCHVRCGTLGRVRAHQVPLLNVKGVD